MIGGIDVRIPSRAEDSSLTIAVRVIRQVWPRAVFENGLSGDRYDRFADIPFGEIEEIFVYRDPASAEVWDAEGAIPEALNRMIHLIYDEGLVTAIVDERNDEINEIIAAMEFGLSDGTWVRPIPVMREAA